MSEPSDTATEPFQFSSRLLFTYVAALLSFMAAGDSLWITAVATVAWAAMVGRMFFRFGLRAGWTLIAAPAALYWLWLILRPTTSDTLIV